MSTVIRIPASLRALTGGASVVEVEGGTVGAALDELERRHPGVKERLVDGGGVRRFVNLYVGEEDIRFSGGLATVLPPGAELSIVPAIAGG